VGVAEALRVPVALPVWLWDWLRVTVPLCDRLCVPLCVPEPLRVVEELGVCVPLGLRDCDGLSVGVPACVDVGLQRTLTAVRRKPRGAGTRAQDTPPSADPKAPVGTAVPFAGTSTLLPTPSSVAYHARGDPGAEKASERFG
jgi:hypothetical protein